MKRIYTVYRDVIRYARMTLKWYICHTYTDKKWRKLISVICCNISSPCFSCVVCETVSKCVCVKCELTDVASNVNFSRKLQETYKMTCKFKCKNKLKEYLFSRTYSCEVLTLYKNDGKRIFRCSSMLGYDNFVRIRLSTTIHQVERLGMSCSGTSFWVSSN